MSSDNPFFNLTRPELIKLCSEQARLLGGTEAKPVVPAVVPDIVGALPYAHRSRLEHLASEAGMPPLEMCVGLVIAAITHPHVGEASARLAKETLNAHEAGSRWWEL